MLTRQPAIPINPGFFIPPPRFFGRAYKVLFGLVTLFLVILPPLFPATGFADQTIVAGVTLNQEKEGDLFVILKDDGDFYIKATDLKSMGIKKLPPHPIRGAGEPYYSLRSLPGIKFKFDENTLTLKITSAPSLLQKKVVDLTPHPRQNVYYPKDTSFFLNYGLDYNLGGTPFSYQGLNLTNEAGLRIDNLLFFTSTSYSDAPAADRFTRLMSNITYDWRRQMQRFVAGDFFANSGDLGSSVNLGGLSFSKLYAINPYFLQNPLFDFSGQLALPSQVDLYLNGIKIRSEQLKPGPFELRNLQSFGGAQNLTIVIRDSLGRERRVVAPFYFTDRMLRKGLNEYSYNLGLLRKNYGLSSDHYAGPAFSFFHRVGVSNDFNLGIRGEWGDSLFNLGFESLTKLGSAGVLGLQASGSIDHGRTGLATQFSYTYQDRRFSFRLALQNFSGGYQTLGGRLMDRKTQYQARAGIGYVFPLIGSLSLDFIDSKSYHEARQTSLNAYYSRRIWRNLYLTSTYRHTESGPSDDEILLNFNYYFGADTSLSASIQQNREGNTETVEARKDLPVGEGLAWQARLQRAQTGSSSTYTIDPALQYNGPHGIYRAEYNRTESPNSAASKENLRLSLSGALVFLGNDLAATRPVTDSFGLVKVGDVKGVRVYANSQEMGRTNARGEVIVPSLNSFYDNEVSIENKDIPMDYLMPTIRKFVSPPYRSGSCLVFPLQKYQAFSGTLVLREGKRNLPLADAEVKLPVDKGTIDFYTDAKGAFYFDNDPTNNPGLSNPPGERDCASLDRGTTELLSPGPHRATVTVQGKSFTTQLPISRAQGPITDLGHVVLTIPESQKAHLPGASAAPMVASATSAGVPPASLHTTRPKTPPVISPKTPDPPPPPHSPPSPSLGKAMAPLPEKKVFFALDKAFLSKKTRASLDRIVGILRKFSGYRVKIYGYAGPLGTEAYNYRLGLRRAKAVRDYLLRQGIAKGRVAELASYGETRLICREQKESCYRRNRRVIIQVVKDQ